MSIFKSKKLGILIPVIVICIAFLFSLVVFPMAYSSPKNIPIAIVNLDEGVITPVGEVNAGKEMLNKMTTITSTSEDEAPIKWIEVSTEEELENGFDNNEYYAAIIIPNNYSVNQASLQTTSPTSPVLKVIINQGQNATVATLVQTLLTTMVNNINKTLQPAILTNIQNANQVITTEQAAVYLEPIKVDVTYINEIGDNLVNGNAHTVMYMITWITTLASSVLLYIYISSTKGENKKEVMSKKWLKVLYGAGIAIILGFLIAFIAKIELGLAIPYLTTAMFISIASFSFMLLILGVLSFTGIKGIAIFVFIMLFGMMTVNLPYELLPSFWQHWIYPWIPIRFITGGLSQILYLSGNLFNGNTVVLISMGVAGLILFGLSFLKKDKKKEVSEKQ